MDDKKQSVPPFYQTTIKQIPLPDQTHQGKYFLALLPTESS